MSFSYLRNDKEINGVKADSARHKINQLSLNNTNNINKSNNAQPSSRYTSNQPSERPKLSQNVHSNARRLISSSVQINNGEKLSIRSSNNVDSVQKGDMKIPIGARQSRESASSSSPENSKEQQDTELATPPQSRQLQHFKQMQQGVGAKSYLLNAVSKENSNISIQDQQLLNQLNISSSFSSKKFKKPLNNEDYFPKNKVAKDLQLGGESKPSPKSDGKLTFRSQKAEETAATKGSPPDFRIKSNTHHLYVGERDTESNLKKDYASRSAVFSTNNSSKIKSVTPTGPSPRFQNVSSKQNENKLKLNDQQTEVGAKKMTYPTQLIQSLAAQNVAQTGGRKSIQLSSDKEIEDKESRYVSSPSQQAATISPQINRPARSFRSSNILASSPPLKIPIFQTILKTRPGQYSQYVRKENQDAGLCELNFCGNSNCSLFGVYDGHGENGGEVSSFVKNRIMKYLQKEIRSQGGLDSDKLDIPVCLNKAYAQTSRELLSQHQFDVSLSGSTAVTVIMHYNKVFCANTGDSRAIIASHNGLSWKQFELSKDHKPENPQERARINSNGGRVEQSTNGLGQKGGIFRVWKKHLDMPGLAMSRSMGDSMGRECGIISEPEIIQHVLSDEDKILVVASDGVWEFISNAEVTSIIAPFFKENKMEESANKIIQLSVKEWLKEGDSVDDITCVLAFFSGFKEIQHK